MQDEVDDALLTFQLNVSSSSLEGSWKRASQVYAQD